MGNRRFLLTILAFGLLCVISFVIWKKYDQVILAWITAVILFFKGFTIRQGFVFLLNLIFKQLLIWLRRILGVLVFWGLLPLSWQETAIRLLRLFRIHGYLLYVKVRTRSKGRFGKNFALVLGVATSCAILVFSVLFGSFWLIFFSFEQIRKFLGLVFGWFLGPIISALQNTIFGKALQQLFSWIDHLPMIVKLKKAHANFNVKLEMWLKDGNEKLYRRERQQTESGSEG